MEFQTKWVNCDCTSGDHVLRFIFDDDASPVTDYEFPTMWMEVHLNTNFSFWRRLWIGLKYIFCKRQVRTGSGCFDTWGTWKSDTLLEMRDIFQRGYELAKRAEERNTERSARLREENKRKADERENPKNSA